MQPSVNARHYTGCGTEHTVRLLWRSVRVQLQPFLQSIQSHDSGRPAIPSGRNLTGQCFRTYVERRDGPLSQFVTLTRSYGAESLSRFNMYNSIAVNAMPADGYSTGDAIKAVQETAVQSLPKGYGYDYGGITREENQQSGTTMIIFGICFLMIYLILSALYESLYHSVRRASECALRIDGKFPSSHGCSDWRITFTCRQV